MEIKELAKISFFASMIIIVVILFGAITYWYQDSVGVLQQTDANEREMRYLLRDLDYLDEDIQQLSRKLDTLITRRLKELKEKKESN